MSECSARKAGSLYGFFISAPQEHLGFELNSTGGLFTLTSKRQSRSWHL